METTSKKKLYFDMDGVLVNFQSGIDKLSDEVKKEYEGRLDEVPGIFGLMEPMPGAIEAVHKLQEYYDVYILSTAPWKNPSAWSDKVAWVTKYLDDVFHKRMVVTHCKHLLCSGNGDYLIDDRDKNGADGFGDNLIRFGSAKFPDWDTVVEYMIIENEAAEMRELFESDNLNRELITETMVEKTVKALDEYAKILNARCEENYTPALNKEILNVSSLTNRWLSALSPEDDNAYYDI